MFSCPNACSDSNVFYFCMQDVSYERIHQKINSTFQQITITLYTQNILNKKVYLCLKLSCQHVAKCPMHILATVNRNVSLNASQSCQRQNTWVFYKHFTTTFKVVLFPVIKLHYTSIGLVSAFSTYIQKTLLQHTPTVGASSVQDRKVGWGRGENGVLATTFALSEHCRPVR